VIEQRAQAPPTRNVGRASARTCAFVPEHEYGEFDTWQRPLDHVVSVQPVVHPKPVRPALPSPDRRVVLLAGRRERWLTALALGLILVVWPLHVVVVAMLAGGAWLIDDSLRDVVPGHARNLRRALTPALWLLAAFGIAATSVWPAAATLDALAFLGLATVLYLCCESVAVLRVPLRARIPGARTVPAYRPREDLHVSTGRGHVRGTRVQGSRHPHGDARASARSAS